MDSSTDDIVKEIPGVIRVYKNGRVQKLLATNVVPAGLDPSSGVQSKDVLFSSDKTLSARLYIPKSTNAVTRKLPLLIYYHGGAFIVATAASRIYHNFLNLIAAESNVVIVSVDYRTAPEHPVPTCFQDSWEAIKWVEQHVNQNGPEQWLNKYSDLGRVFFCGDSTGANIAHHMGIRIGTENRSGGIYLQGIILLHPYFWGKDRVGSEPRQHPLMRVIRDLWLFAHPDTIGLDDPLINPALDPKVADLGCSRVLVCVGEKDILKDRGWYYKMILRKNGWRGDIEILEDKGEVHTFFLFKPCSQNACNLRNRIRTFINRIKAKV
ncbi:probable carboxylesterase 12 [Cynara cardunculus var. scolymus]|uniref:probable carboxylesterase 12 n=1 Tax=Cynara cardunculus var. scolymus TaxID=59895 RepID=UPI000D624FD8|nr:probable carboxylesterase 12 [Cynara cardunculus var. scolymus]